MVPQDEYERLLKMLGMLSSDSDGEVLNAVTAISRVLNTHGLAWRDIVLPRKLLPVRVDPTEAMPATDGDGQPKALGAASPKEMLTALMASPNVSPETKKDLRQYRAAIAEGRLTPNIRADIQALYAYAIVGGRRA